MKKRVLPRWNSNWSRKKEQTPVFLPFYHDNRHNALPFYANVRIYRNRSGWSNGYSEYRMEYSFVFYILWTLVDNR